MNGLETPWTSCSSLGIRYHAVVKISPADFVTARSTNDQWSCWLMIGDKVTSSSERPGDGKVVFLRSGVDGSEMDSILQSISSELTSQSLTRLLILEWNKNSPSAL